MNGRFSPVNGFLTSSNNIEHNKPQPKQVRTLAQIAYRIALDEHAGDQHVLHAGRHVLGTGNLIDRPHANALVIKAHRGQMPIGHDISQAVVNAHHAYVLGHTPNRLAAVSGGTIDILDEDLEIMREAALYNDYLGVNNYQCRFLKAYDGENDLHHNGTGEKGTGRWRVKGIGEHVNKPGIPTTDWDWIIYPEGLFDLLVHIKQRYPNYKQIFITENGMGYKDPYKDGFVDDQPRIDYIEQHLRWLLKAMEVGVNVGGYFLWSLQDQFSWTNGYNKRYGFFYVDFETQKRTPKASAYWYKHVAQTRRLD